MGLRLTRQSFLNELPTIHDGGRQNTPSTHFFARALLSPQQSEMVGILRFLAKNKYDAINDFDLCFGTGTSVEVSLLTGPLPDISLLVLTQPYCAELDEFNFQTGKLGYIEKWKSLSLSRETTQPLRFLISN